MIDEDGKQLGIMPPYDALRMARSGGLDLVEVAPTANPPVCRIINYGKYLYQLSKRQHEARKHQKSIELKEVKFRPRTSEHDFEVKRNHIVKFLQEGSKVKATIMFRGREMAHRNIGMRMMERLIEEVSEFSQVEARPRQEGPNLTAILAPKKAAGKGAAAAPRPARIAPAAPVGAKSAAASPAAAAPSRSDSSGSSGG
ncbi:MAG: translation initiation factor IF-3 [Acidobacteriia bacterium]|nr:translation initiation factor IF-3 [Terriglobia bacterium]